jgi:hypothetical protein
MRVRQPLTLFVIALGLFPALDWAAGAPTSTGVSVPVTVNVPEAGTLSVALRDAQGHSVRTLAALADAQAGDNTLQWDGLDDEGQPAAPGDYQALWLAGNVYGRYLGHLGNVRVPRGPDTPVDNLFLPMNGAMVVGLATGDDGKSLYACYSHAERPDHLSKYDRDGDVIWQGGPAGTGPICVYQDRVYTAWFDDQTQGSGPQRSQEVIAVCSATDGTIVRPAGWPDLPVVSSVHPLLYNGMSDLEWHGVFGLAAYDGKLFVPLYWENRISVRDLTTFKEIASLPNVPQPKGIAVGPWGLAVVAAEEVWVYDPNLKFVRAIGALAQPWALAASPQGDLYVTELGGVNRVVKVSLDGKIQWARGWKGPLSGEVLPDKLYGPISLAVGPQGDYYVGEFFMNRLRAFDDAGQERWEFLGQTPTFPDPRDPTVWWGGFFSPGGWGITRFKVNLDTLEYYPDRWYSEPTIPGPDPLATAGNGPRVLDDFTYKGRTYLTAGGPYASIFDITDAGDPHLTELPLRAYLGSPLTLPVDGARLSAMSWWADQNGNQRPDPGEVVDTGIQMTGGSLQFPAPGHLAVIAQYGPKTRLIDMPFQSLTPCGAPTFSPDSFKTIFTSDDNMQDPFPVQACLDRKGNWWLRMTRGGARGDYAQMRKYAPDGALLWGVGKQARGRKVPGTFSAGANSTFRMMLLDDDYVFSGDANGQVDVINRDGLWTALLLSGGHWYDGDPLTDPYVEGGGEATPVGVYHLGNRVVYLGYDAGANDLRLFEITGLEDLHQGQVSLHLDREAQPAGR